MNITIWNIPQNIPLANPGFQETREVNMLIEVSLFWDLLVDGKVKLGKGMPVLQNSKLGWIISGPTPISISSSSCSFSKTVCHEDEQLNKFWELEQIHSCPLISEDDLQRGEFSKRLLFVIVLGDLMSDFH